MELPDQRVSYYMERNRQGFQFITNSGVDFMVLADVFFFFLFFFKWKRKSFVHNLSKVLE